MSLSPLEGAPDISRDRELDREDPGTVVALISPEDERWGGAVELEAQTFVKRNYVQSPEELQEEYAPYLSKTSMIVATRSDTSGAAGCSRVIEYDPDIGFKTTDDALDDTKPLKIDESGWQVLDEVDHANIYEVGTISAHPDAGAELYGAIIGHGLDATPRRQHVIASLDETVLMRRVLPLFGDSVTILGPPADYMGSPTIPVLIDLEKAWNNIAGNDQFHEAFDRIEKGREMVTHGH